MAAGLVPVAHATDAGGSIRIPSSLTGTVGLKPSRGRVSQGPEVGDAFLNGSWYLGAITSTVRDAAAVLDAVSGYMPGDPFCAPPPERTFLSEVGRSSERLRIGFMQRAADGYDPIHSEVRAGTVATAELLAEMGHEVVEAHPAALDHQDVLEAFMAVVGSGVGWLLDRWSSVLGRPIVESDVEPGTWMMLESTRSVTGSQFIASVERTTRFGREVASWWDEYDVLLTPTMAVPAFELGALDAPGDPAEATRRSVAITGGFTVPFNVSGQPAISLPLHLTAAGLPYGLQFVARYGREDVLFRLAAELEQATPWAQRVPAVHASRR
ncbi:amidase [Nocardioides marmoriginsengisoli]|uniref:Amidase n=1 Tax=Nocardioides marmoriginsengisoli TaxID=661483 RepID=A0A3N0CIN7_9ACTN|nr:amidase [Nocardioides marmoriginsengisoli]